MSESNNISRRNGQLLKQSRAVYLYIFFLLGISFLGPACRSIAAPPATGERTATLTWAAPEQIGHEKAELAGYAIYYGPKPDRLEKVIKVPLESEDLFCRKIKRDKESLSESTECTYVIQGIDEGKQFFAVKAYNRAGVESDFSNKASKE